MDVLAADPAIKIAHLKRNPLESLRSLVQARATGRWQRTGTDDDPPRVSISVSECEDFFERCARQKELIEARFSAHPRLTVDYSTTLVAPTETLFRLHDFLEVPRVPLRPETYLKQEHRRLADTVLNFAELRRAFRSRPEAGFFNCLEPSEPAGR